MDQKSPSARSLDPLARNRRASAVLLAATPPASCFYLGEKEINSELLIPMHPRCVGSRLLFIDRDVSRRIPHHWHRPENSRSQVSARDLAVVEHFGMRWIADSK